MAEARPRSPESIASSGVAPLAGRGRHVEGTLDGLERRGILIPDRRSVAAYLGEHNDLLPSIEQTAALASAQLGARSELSLEVVHDREVAEHHLVLVVRQAAYDPDLMASIRAVMDATWLLPPDTTGWFHVSTDFGPPRRGVRGVRLA